MLNDEISSFQMKTTKHIFLDELILAESSGLLIYITKTYAEHQALRKLICHKIKIA